jgi:hypothetical protein
MTVTVSNDVNPLQSHSRRQSQLLNRKKFQKYNIIKKKKKKKKKKTFLLMGKNTKIKYFFNME